LPKLVKGHDYTPYQCFLRKTNHPLRGKKKRKKKGKETERKRDLRGKDDTN